MIARYDFSVGSLDAHLQGALVAQTDAKSDLRIVNRTILGDQPGYASVDLSAGVGKDNWSFEIYADNLFDKRGDIFRFTQCTETICGDESDVTASGGRIYTVPIKPRLIGVKFSHRF